MITTYRVDTQFEEHSIFNIERKKTDANYRFMHTNSSTALNYETFESNFQIPIISINNSSDQEEEFSAFTPRLIQPIPPSSHFNYTDHLQIKSTEQDTTNISSKTVESAKKIGLLQLIVTAFFCVSGGAYGIEPIVAACPYPFYLLLGLLIFPMIWSLPMALVCAELSTLFPEHSDGSIVIWTQMAFGRFFAFVIGFSSSISNLIDICLYPIIFMDYFLDPKLIDNTFLPFYGRALIGIAFVLLLTIVNLLGAEGVSIVSLLFTVAVFAPFLLMFMFGLSELKPHIWIQGWNTSAKELSENVQWSTYLSIMIWNNVGWTNVGFLCNDVKNPNKTFSKGMFFGVILTTLNYLLPTALGMALYSRETWQHWDVGYFSTVALKIAGPWLAYLVALGAAISNAGLFNASLLTASKNIAFLANNKMLPQWMGWTWKRTSSPLVAILFQSALVCVLINLPFEFLLGIEICITGLSIIMLYLSFVVLRFTYAKKHRPFRVPCNRWVCIPLILVPISICVWNVVVAGWQIQVAGFVAVLVSSILYPLFCYKDVLIFIKTNIRRLYKK